MALLDQHGRPVKPRDLTQPLAEGGIAGVRQAWPDSTAAGLTPARMASILTACDSGDLEAFMMLAEEMEERDPHYASVLGQRKRAVSGVTPRVIPESEEAADEKVAEWVREHVTEHDGWVELVEDLLDAVGKGFSVVEIDWSTKTGAWVPATFIHRSQRFFMPDRETGRSLRLRDETAPVDGLPLMDHKFLVHRARLKSGQFFRGGIARVVAFSWMCKAYTLKDWMAFVETYGLPLRLGRYGPEATPKDVQTLFRAVANIGTDAAAVIPRFMDIEFVENSSGKGGTNPIFENLARYVDEQISKAVLGQTMTTDDGSSMAQAEVHNDVRHDIALSDARAVAGTINRDLVASAVAFNFGSEVSPPRVAIDIAEPEDIEKTVKSMVSLAQVGVSFRMSDARSKVGASDPEEGDEVFGGDLPRTSPDTARQVHTARAGDEVDEIAEIRDAMMADWEPDMAELLEPILDAIDAADSYEDALRRIEALEALPSGRLVERLASGMFRARALGDVEDG